MSHLPLPKTDSSAAADGSLRERFFYALKHRHPNLHTLYLSFSVIGIWSGLWYIFDTWALGLPVMSEANPLNMAVVLRHLGLLLGGLFLLYIDGGSLTELVVMGKTDPEESDQPSGLLSRFFLAFKTKLPTAATVYAMTGIIGMWCGLWGLMWDVPINPFWRSVATVVGGFFLLWIDDLKIDEL